MIYKHFLLKQNILEQNHITINAEILRKGGNVEQNRLEEICQYINIYILIYILKSDRLMDFLLF